MASLALLVGSGLPGSLADVVGIAGTVVLLLVVVALAGFAYRSLTGDGIEWPAEAEEAESDDDVRRGRTDEEWEYY